MKSPGSRIRIGRIDLAVRQSGEGTPLVWGHSLMGSMWTEDIADLIDWDALSGLARIVRYDARGHGESSGTTDARDYRWETMAQDMLSLAESVATASGAGKYVLGGISMGAATALEAAVQRPDRVAGLILVLPPTAWDTRPRQAAIYRRMAMISGLLGAAPYRLLDWLPKPVSDNAFSRLALATIKGLAKANPRFMQATLKGAAMPDMPPKSKLGKLRVPTLILAWEDDKAHPVSTARALAETLPDIYKLSISGSGEQPDWTGQIVAFMASLGAPKPRRTKPKASSRGRRAAA